MLTWCVGLKMLRDLGDFVRLRRRSQGLRGKVQGCGATDLLQRVEKGYSQARITDQILSLLRIEADVFAIAQEVANRRNGVRASLNYRLQVGLPNRGLLRSEARPREIQRSQVLNQCADR